MAPNDRTDQQLLEAYLDGDERSFATLVERHAGMVAGICRRVLAGADTDDAVQAVFLTLAHKADRLRTHPTLAGWLYRVAGYVSQRARKSEQARKRAEGAMANPSPTTSDQSPWDMIKPHLDRELSALPEHYRLPIILHHFEGKTKQEIATLLRRPDSTISMRLVRGRELLRRRLERHGCAINALALASLLSERASAETISAGLISATAKTAPLVTAGAQVTGNALAMSLSRGVLASMSLMQRAKVAGIAAAVLMVCGLGMTALHAQNQNPVATIEEKPVSEQATPKAEAVKGPDQRAILARLIGIWKVRVTMWPAPGGEPNVGEGETTFSETLDGAWIKEDYQGDYLGNPYVELNLHTYDSMRKKYVALCLHNVTSGMMLMDGESKDAGKSVEFVFREGQGPADRRMVRSFDRADQMTLTMYRRSEGQPESKEWELVYTRIDYTTKFVPDAEVYSGATVVPVADVAKALDYYVKVLGFHQDFVYGNTYAGVSLGSVRVHLNGQTGGAKPGVCEVYIFTKEVDKRYAALLERKAQVVWAPHDEPYGLRDFAVRDLDGNQITFAVVIMNQEPAPDEGL